MAQLLIKRVYFPRTDFPQDGWIGFVTTPAAFDAALYPPNVQLGGSFRMNKRRGEFQVFIEQPQIGWFDAVVGGPSAGLRTLALTGVGL